MSRWGGRDYYFGPDHAAAEAAFLDPDGRHPGALVNWQRWKLSRPQRSTDRRTVKELVEAFCDHYEAQGRRSTARDYRKHLSRFAHTFGTLYVDEIDAAAIASIRTAMLAAGYAPKTISHDLGAIKTCWRWGMDAMNLPTINLASRLIKAPRSLEPLPVRLTRRQRIAALDAAAARDRTTGPTVPRLEAWLAVQYLCLLRPSEVPRAIAAFNDPDHDATPHTDDADTLPPFSVLRIKSKTDHQGWPRFVWVSAQAHQWLSSTSGSWAWQTYARHVRNACGVRSKDVQKSAASDLRHLGASREDVNLLLGHAPRLVERSYIQEASPRLVNLAAQLSLR